MHNTDQNPTSSERRRHTLGFHKHPTVAAPDEDSLIFRLEPVGAVHTSRAVRFLAADTLHTLQESVTEVDSTDLFTIRVRIARRILKVLRFMGPTSEAGDKHFTVVYRQAETDANALDGKDLARLYDRHPNNEITQIADRIAGLEPDEAIMRQVDIVHRATLMLFDHHSPESFE